MRPGATGTGVRDRNTHRTFLAVERGNRYEHNRLRYVHTSLSRTVKVQRALSSNVGGRENRTRPSVMVSAHRSGSGGPRNVFTWRWLTRAIVLGGKTMSNFIFGGLKRELIWFDLNCFYTSLLFSYQTQLFFCYFFKSFLHFPLPQCMVGNYYRMFCLIQTT